MHQPQHAPTAGADALEAQPGPQLAVALAMERAGGEKLADRLHQVAVRHRPERPGAPLAHDRCFGSMTVAVDGRPRHAPEPGDPREAIDTAGGGRELPAHRL